jgi:hypothetical protein
MSFASLLQRGGKMVTYKRNPEHSSEKDTFVTDGSRHEPGDTVSRGGTDRSDYRSISSIDLKRKRKDSTRSGTSAQRRR